MKDIDTRLTSSEKLAVARDYAAQLFNAYPAIDSIIVTGSVVRGQDIPVSDVDMGYVVKKGSPALPIQKGVHQGVYLDIEPLYVEDLALDTIANDAYVLGYIRDALILHDRCGHMADLKERIEKEGGNAAHKREQLAAIRQSAARNGDDFARAVQEHDAPEICRSVIFALWCFSEWLLVKHDRPPGGFRCLSRLKLANTDAFIQIAAFQDSLQKDSTRLGRFYPLVAQGIKADTFHVQKYTWMNQHGFKDEAFHMLWILLGLDIKGEKNEHNRKLAELWLKELAWDEAVLRHKAGELQDLFRTYDL
ncbi:MAG: hypothetical protein JXA89_17845 [Anaerolineae bacterium]|nr:hypothetical protein [Anaerolineae bacterium]